MEKVYVDYNSIKNEKLRELESIACDEMMKKVKELDGIVDSIGQNWHGANAERYHKEIEEIMETISKFKRNCIEKNLSDINEQVEKYKNYEELG